MSDPIRDNVGYHRVLILFCSVCLWVMYPEEGSYESWPEILHDVLRYEKMYLATFYLLTWVVLSDALANIWRLGDFLRQKATSWNYWKFGLDLVVIVVLWFVYRGYINPAPEPPEEEEVEAILRLLKPFG